MGELRSKIVERHYADLRSNDWDRMKQLFSDDVVTEMPGVGTLRGVAPFVEFAKVFFAAFPEGRIDIRSTIEQGNTIIAESTMIATQTGPLATPGGQTIPPTGKSIELPVADVFVVDGDKVVQHRVYFDQMSMMNQLGLVPEPAGATA